MHIRIYDIVWDVHSQEMSGVFFCGGEVEDATDVEMAHLPKEMFVEDVGDGEINRDDLYDWMVETEAWMVSDFSWEFVDEKLFF